MVDMVSTTEAAAILGRSDNVVRKRISAGKLAAEKVEGKWRVPRTALADVQAPANRLPDIARGRGGSVAEPQAQPSDAERHTAALERQVEEQSRVIRALTDLIAATYSGSE